jgi:YYY domain-containing protein
MTAFIAWYSILTLLGWLTFPLVHHLFPALADRGYTLSRAAGLLIWGYIFWMFASLGIAQNDTGGILLALALLAGLSAWSFVNHRSSIFDFLKENTSLAVTTEILFFAAFAFLAFVRSANPELTTTEKPMELAFINGILRSPVFPPQDPWLSGYAISYYYFGYVMTAMLARLSGITGSMAHNLMTSLVFALGAVGAYGILYNLLSNADRGPKTEDGDENNKDADSSVLRPLSSVHGLSLLAPLFLLLVSNFGALLEILHQRGFFWVKDPATGEYSSRFWAWLDMKELSQIPALPFHWVPDRYLWWWRASRVLQDYDMRHNPLEVIDEFPFFSFLLGDLHPHVLAIPFSLLAIAAALNLFLGSWRGTINFFGARLHINSTGFLFSALVVGGLAFLNTWDILVAATLIVASYVIWRANEDGWRWERLEDLFLFGLPLGILSLLLYFPFYLGFSSQAGGILPSLMYPTRGIHLWVMWGTLLIPIFAYLIYLWRGEKIPSNWKLGFSLGLGFALFLWLFALAIGWIGSFVEKDFVAAFLAAQGMTAGEFFSATSLRRLSYIGSLITLLAVLIPTLAFLFERNYRSEIVNRGLDTPLTPALAGGAREEHTSTGSAHRSGLLDHQSEIGNHKSQIANQFVLLLLALGAILVLVPDFVYLRDKFGYRINTVFKFYYQAWMLWSLAAAFATAYLLQNLRDAKNIIFRVVIGLVIFAGLLYPVFGLLTKTNGFKPAYGFTLDDFDRIVRENPDEAAAIEFLRTAPDGVIAEAIGDGYSAYARISAHTGLQTVLGWPGHEDQWRGSYTPQGSRRDDIMKLYTTPRWEEAQLIIKQYNIRYIYVGVLERISMTVNEGKFQTHLKPIFQQGDTIIYEVP